MENQRPVVCPENEDLAAFMWKKRQEMVEASSISDRIDATLSKAYASVCGSKNHIKTIKDFSQVKGVGNWTLRLMQTFFHSASATSPLKEQKRKGKKTKRYVPQKNSVAYALLITLYRGISNGNTFMRKQELIDAAEASGLSRAPIAPEKGKGKLTQLGSSPREWYSGWSCMKTLITKGLIVKSSCPAKYMLTQEGQEAARECLQRSGLIDSSENLTVRDGGLDCQSSQDTSNLIHHSILDHDHGTLVSAVSVRQKKSDKISTCVIDQHAPTGRIWQKTSTVAPEYTKPSILAAESSHSQKCVPSIDLAVSGHPPKDPIYILDSDSEEMPENQYPVLLNQHTSINIDEEENGERNIASVGTIYGLDSSFPSDSPPAPLTLRACSSSEPPCSLQPAKNLEGDVKSLAMPPRSVGENFEDVYDVILILDDREQFAKTIRGARSRKIVESISTQFKIKVEIKRLPVGDGIWIARHKHLHTEYVLDFIVERKEVDDLRGSIRDNRYKEQKTRLLACGLQKLIYLVEGDPNLCDAAESIKTACFTTEILEGFDVQRTNCLTETLKKYGHLTRSICDYYQMQFSKELNLSCRICPTLDEFTKKCQDLDKMTVSDVFSVQLMQVPQVTEQVAHAVIELYPTVLSLARAYSRLDGDPRAQEEMLKKETRISAAASRNIFKLIWGC